MLMKPDMLPENPQYAPQYAIAFRLGFMAAAVIALWALERIMPWLMQQPFWLCHPHGLSWLYYGLLATPPLLTGIWALAYRGRRAWQALRTGQYPPPGSKVWLAGVRYAYGAAAQRRAGRDMAIAVLLLLSVTAVSLFMLHLFGPSSDLAAPAAYHAAHCPP
ncbi:hypothetical protein L1281_002149 [Neisseria sp. HSC-16F19]|nr:hypothetical protein [Neisseria sp. HSC-16F19]MCP2041542.1 hypothetical protein [Neisseria sp. HSC-16F19]